MKLAFAALMVFSFVSPSAFAQNCRKVTHTYTPSAINDPNITSNGITGKISGESSDEGIKKHFGLLDADSPKIIRGELKIAKASIVLDKDGVAVNAKVTSNVVTKIEYNRQDTYVEGGCQ